MPLTEGHIFSGNNLEVLTALREDRTVSGHVRLVYIDPPFGTGQVFTYAAHQGATISRAANGKLAYSDELSGNDYLGFLYKRLVLLKELMAADASIYVHIDCKIGHYVKVLMDQVFGQQNFRNDITRIKCNPKNFPRNSFGNVKDIILFYTNGKQAVWNHPREDHTATQLDRLFPKLDAAGRRYTTTPLHAPGETRDGPTGQPWRGLTPPSGRHWRYPPVMLDQLEDAGLIEWSSTGNPRKIIYCDEAQALGCYRQDVWHFKDPPRPRYPTEKNLDMLRVIVEASSNLGDLVLDCFAGSGTTLVAAQQLGRRWIGIDQSEMAVKVCEERTGVRATSLGSEVTPHE
jgi:adenine-specific DNA-methyltransferase